MYIESKNGVRYRITNSSSIYTSRNGLNDIRLQRAARSGDGGAMADDGRRYVTVAVWATESLESIRHYGQLPTEVTLALLPQWFALPVPVTT